MTRSKRSVQDWKALAPEATDMTARSAIPVRFVVLSADDVPADDAWLAGPEREAVARFRVGKRRRDWRLGRWTAKRLLVSWLGLERGADTFSRIAISAAEDGAPEAFLDGRSLGLALSLSHSDDRAVAAIAPAGTALGCDLERIRSLRAATVRDHFTAAERDFVESRTGDERSLLATLVWSAKESALKALRTGMRLDTRDVEVETPIELRAGVWQSLVVHRIRPMKRGFTGWWRVLDGFVLIIVGDPAAMLPVSLARRRAGGH
jgi:4'-phosphopantetheinyl transferase